MRTMCARQAIASLGANDLKFKLLVGQIRFVLAGDRERPRNAGDRVRSAAVDRFFLREQSDSARAVEKNAVAIQQAADVRVGFLKLRDERAN